MKYMNINKKENRVIHYDNFYIKRKINKLNINRYLDSEKYREICTYYFNYFVINAMVYVISYTINTCVYLYMYISNIIYYVH